MNERVCPHGIFNTDKAHNDRAPACATHRRAVNYQRIQAELTNAVNYTAVVAQGLQNLVSAGQLPAAQCLD